MGDHSLEAVMRPCQVIHFIVRTSKKYILFVLFSSVFSPGFFEGVVGGWGRH